MNLFRVKIKNKNLPKNTVFTDGKLSKFKRWPENFGTVFVKDLIFNLLADFFIIFWFRVVLAHRFLDFRIHPIKSFLVETFRILHSKHKNHTLKLTLSRHLNSPIIRLHITDINHCINLIIHRYISLVLYWIYL